MFFSTTDYLGVVHSYLLGFFMRVFGVTLYTPRLYMVLMGALTVVLTYWFAREVAGRRVAVITAGLMLTSPMHILIGSHVAWMNCATPVFSLLMLIAFYRGMVSGGGWALALSGLLAGVTVLQTHPIIALLFPGMILSFIVYHLQTKRPLRLWVATPRPLRGHRLVPDRVWQYHLVQRARTPVRLAGGSAARCDAPRHL